MLRAVRTLATVFALVLVCSPGASAMVVTCGCGVDLGTSGVRVCVVEQGLQGVKVVGEASRRWSDEDGSKPEVWLAALREALAECPNASNAGRIAVSGTSASVLGLDTDTGAVSRQPMMYNEAVTEKKALALIKEHAPKGHTTLAPTSSLAKLVAWKLGPSEVIAHQADYVATALSCGEGRLDGPVFSDWHNALKLGFDVEHLKWPEWITEGVLGGSARSLTRLGVLRPGFAKGRAVSSSAAEYWGLREGAAVVGGTTDSIAAFLACSADENGAISIKPGCAVTSLGSTTALKLVSTVKCDDAERGVYSHRLDDSWLVGGASNCGCQIFRHLEFSDEELKSLSASIEVDGTEANSEEIYPLVSKGERFPFSDPLKVPRLPISGDRAVQLKKLLIGIADVERVGYDALRSLGATPLVSVRTAGGGSKNPTWSKIRGNLLGVKVESSRNTDAAFGAALLALRYQDQDTV